MEEEIWKDILGFEGYQISSIGRIRSYRLAGKSRKTRKLGLECKLIKANIKRCGGKLSRPYIKLTKLQGGVYYSFQISRLLWETFKGPIPEGMCIDHKDCNPFNNTFDNLRLCTRAQNGHNKGPNKKKTAEVSYKGVRLTKSGRYSAHIGYGGKRYELGTYSTELEAALAYDKAAKEKHGEFAKLNIVEEVIN